MNYPPGIAEESEHGCRRVYPLKPASVRPNLFWLAIRTERRAARMAGSNLKDSASFSAAQAPGVRKASTVALILEKAWGGVPV